MYVNYCQVTGGMSRRKEIISCVLYFWVACVLSGLIGLLNMCYWGSRSSSLGSYPPTTHWYKMCARCCFSRQNAAPNRALAHSGPPLVNVPTWALLHRPHEGFRTRSAQRNSKNGTVNTQVTNMCAKFALLGQNAAPNRALAHSGQPLVDVSTWTLPHRSHGGFRTRSAQTNSKNRPVNTQLANMCAKFVLLGQIAAPGRALAHSAPPLVDVSTHTLPHRSHGGLRTRSAQINSKN
jgi:hypothetical protein